MSKQDWENLNNEIISCKKCKRLVAFRKKVAKEKTKRFREWNYWGKPWNSWGIFVQNFLLLIKYFRFVKQNTQNKFHLSFGCI